MAVRAAVLVVVVGHLGRAVLVILLLLAHLKGITAVQIMLLERTMALEVVVGQAQLVGTAQLL